MSILPTISVCVPTYDRPEMLEQLIASFIRQDYASKELVIADDSPNEIVQHVAKSSGVASLKYCHNKTNLGYGKNLLKALQCATGDYIVVLGDDDVFLSPHALSRYVDVFVRFPDVGFVHCNNVQFSNALTVENLVRYFEVDQLYHRGEDAMRNIWTTSTFIPGIAIRNDIPFADLYPKEDMLFPQVELIGHIVNRSSAFGIADFLVAGRAHPAQLGFYAIRGERIKGSERHGTLELLRIFARLSSQYRFDFGEEFLVREQIQRFSVTILKERLVVGRSGVRQNYRALCAARDSARHSMRLGASFVIAMGMPNFAIRVIRRCAIMSWRVRHRRQFREKQQLLRRMAETS
jgi:glycosyltransferase involved in cell wall biosynthesis